MPNSRPAVRPATSPSTAPAMTNEPAEFLADDVDPADLDTATLVALIEASHDSLDAFLDEPAARDRIDAHDVRPSRDRPDALTGTTQRIDTGYDHIYVNVNTDVSGRPVELFTTYGKSGGFTQSFTEAIQNLATLALRENVAPEAIVAQLRGIRSPKIGYDHDTRVDSIPDGIGLALERVLNDEVPGTHLETAPQTGLNPIITARSATTATSEGTDDDADDAPATPPSSPAATPSPDKPEADATATASSPPGSESAAPDDDPQAAPGAAPGDDPHMDIDPAQHHEDAALPDDPEPCPECGSLHLAYAEGCQTCQNCGWSECG